MNAKSCLQINVVMASYWTELFSIVLVGVNKNKLEKVASTIWLEKEDFEMAVWHTGSHSAWNICIIEFGYKSLLCFQFLLMHTLGDSSHDSGRWAPATHVVGCKWVPGSWLWFMGSQTIVVPIFLVTPQTGVQSRPT